MTDRHGPKRRSFGVTIGCLVLGWLSMAGFGNAIVLFGGFFLPFLPRWVGLFALAYGITAGVAAYKYWHMCPSARRWLGAWAAVIISMVAAISIYAEIVTGA